MTLAGKTLAGTTVAGTTVAGTRLSLDLDLTTTTGRATGSIRMKWSDNANPLGQILIPVHVFSSGPGPTVLLLAGVHGDEYEGPAAILRLLDLLASTGLTGRVLAVPALNLPAVMAASRVTPLDGANMNRAFPGDPDGGPTAMLAHFTETVLLPMADAVVDLHSGGKASVFAPSALATETADPDLFARNMDLARAFGMPVTWLLGGMNDNRSVNAAAERAGVPMIAAELGGGGGTDPDIVASTVAGLRRVLASLGMIAETAEPAPAARLVRITALDQTVVAPARGLFDRLARAGEPVAKGDLLGWLRPIDDPILAARALIAPCDGLVLAHGNRGIVERGEMLVQLAVDAVA